MTIIPGTTPVPKPGIIFMAPTSPAPTPAASSTNGSSSQTVGNGPTPSHSLLPDRTAHTEPSVAAKPKPSLPLPTLRLEIRHLSHPGAVQFLANSNASILLENAVHNIHTYLYSDSATTHCPPTRSVTVILRDMSGVAYTTGTELDPQHHKEIHVSLNYLASISPPARAEDEINGVLTHELVHCYQHNAQGSCPGGLIEGVADWVRLCCGLSPPHWKRETKGKWDGGYQHTAYFLEYLEQRFGAGTVRAINERLRGRKYEEKEFWTGLLGRPVEQLWGDYVHQVENEAKSGNVDEGTQT